MPGPRPTGRRLRIRVGASGVWRNLRPAVQADHNRGAVESRQPESVGRSLSVPLQRARSAIRRIAFCGGIEDLTAYRDGSEPRTSGSTENVDGSQCRLQERPVLPLIEERPEHLIDVTGMSLMVCLKPFEGIDAIHAFITHADGAALKLLCLMRQRMGLEFVRHLQLVFDIPRE